LTDLAAAELAHRGMSPYSQQALQSAEQALHVPFSIGNFPYLPIVAWLLTPATLQPFWISFAVLSVIGAAIAVTSLSVWVREAGWKRAGLRIIAAMGSCVMFWGFFFGQFDAVLLGGLVGSLVLMRRNRPWLAGACMVVVLLKPELIWPLPILLFAVWTPQWARAWRFAAAAGVAVVAGGAAGFVLVPGAGAFFTNLMSFAGTVQTTQPDLAGIPGLLITLPGGPVMGDGVVVIGAAAVVVLAWSCLTNSRLRALRDVERGVVPLTGLAVWLACTPYAHTNDDVLLLPLLVLLIGVRGSALNARGLAVGMIGCLGMTAIFFVSVQLGDVVVVLGAAAWFWTRNRVPSLTCVIPSAALVAIEVLPTVLLLWPLHLITISLTPLAAALVAVAGGGSLLARLRAMPATQAIRGRSLAPPRLADR